MQTITLQLSLFKMILFPVMRPQQHYITISRLGWDIQAELILILFNI